MGLLTRLREAASGRTTVPAILLEGDEGVAVVGESHYHDVLLAACRRAPLEQVRHPIIALLVPDPSNPYDPEAIAVLVEGLTVGYLSREDARAYANLVHGCADQGRMAACRGRICSREGAPHLGVWLGLPAPDEALPL